MWGWGRIRNGNRRLSCDLRCVGECGCRTLPEILRRYWWSRLPFVEFYECAGTHALSIHEETVWAPLDVPTRPSTPTNHGLSQWTSGNRLIMHRPGRRLTSRRIFSALASTVPDRDFLILRALFSTILQPESLYSADDDLCCNWKDSARFPWKLKTFKALFPLETRLRCDRKMEIFISCFGVGTSVVADLIDLFFNPELNIVKWILKYSYDYLK